VTGTYTQHQASNKRLELVKCIEKKKKKRKERKKKHLPVLYGKADFNVSIEVTAE